MSWLQAGKLAGRRTRTKSRGASKARAQGFRPRLEYLEDRRLLAVNPKVDVWTPIGPAPVNAPIPENGPVTAGRVDWAVGDPGNGNVIYIATDNGGIWKSSNFQSATPTWTPLTDDQPSLSFGTDSYRPLALAPQDARIIYGAVSSGGGGILVSNDAGTTWTLRANATFQLADFASIVVSSTDTRTLYVAARSNPNGGGGVYKSIDGGLTWANKTSGIHLGGASDVVIDPTNPLILYAGLIGASGGGTNGIYKTIDGGTIWTLQNSGILSGPAIGASVRLAISKSAPADLYATVFDPALGNAPDGLPHRYKSTDSGATWTQLSPVPTQDEPRYWHAVLSVDPTDPQIVYSNSSGNLYQSTNGGGAWTLVYAEDPVGVAFDRSNNVIILGSRGIYEWAGTGNPVVNKQNNLQNIELYSVGLDPTNSGTAYGVALDQFHALKFTNNLAWDYLGNLDPALNGAAQFGKIIVDPNMATRIYQYAPIDANGVMYRSDDSGATWVKKSTGLPTATAGSPQVIGSIHAFEIDPTNPNRLLVGTQQVFETTNNGDAWTAISQTTDLSPGKFVSAVGISASKADTVYAGTDDGHFYVTTDHGATWQRRDTGLPIDVTAHVLDIEVDPKDDKRVFVITAAFLNGFIDNRHVYTSTDAGVTWTNITGDLPVTSVPQSLAVDWRPATPKLFVGTVRGVYSTADLANWTIYGTGLPNVVVEDLQYIAKKELLAAATFGRGVWEILTANLVQPKLSIDNVSVLEGDSGTKNAVFTVTLSPASTQQVTVAFATADGTATAGSDYVSQSGTLTFAAGATTQKITVVINGDTTIEPNETYTVVLSNPVNAQILDPTGDGTITNDDNVTLLNINDAAVQEGNSGTTPMIFTVTLSKPATQQVTVVFTTANGTATAGTDYVAQTGTLTFDPGVTSQPIDILVNGDTLLEPSETFSVTLSNAVGVTIGTGTGTGTIIDDDSAAGLSVTEATVKEGSTGTTQMVFGVNLSGQTLKVVTVAYSTADESATAGVDYVAQSGTLTFAPGTSSQNVTVIVNGDTQLEGNETFLLKLSNATNAKILKSQGVGTILDDDATSGAVYIDDITVTATESFDVDAVFTVALANVANQTVTVAFATADGTAVAGSDYEASSGTLTFAPGVKTQTIHVPVFPHAAGTPNETFSINLSDPGNAVIADPQATATIVSGLDDRQEFIVDDGDGEFVQSGNWSSSTNLLAYQLDFHLSAAGNGTDKVTWFFSDLEPGEYQVLVHWIPFANWASDAPFTVYDDTASRGTVRVNQQHAPGGPVSGGFTWEPLGIFDITTGTMAVTLTDNANGYVVADAVRVIKGAPIAVPHAVVSGNGEPIANSDANPSAIDGTYFGTVSLGAGATHTFAISNTGDAPLGLTGNPHVQITGANAADFVVLAQPADSVGAGGATTFDIQFVPQGLGSRTALITIATDDSQQNPFSFMVEGSGVAAGFAPWQNPSNNLDTNNDGSVAGLDVLVIVNALNAGKGGPVSSPATPPPYLDSNGDNVVSALDALLVINSLNSLQSNAMAQGTALALAIGESTSTSTSASFAKSSAPAAPASTKPVSPTGPSALALVDSAYAAPANPPVLVRTPIDRYLDIEAILDAIAADLAAGIKPT